LNLQLLAEDFAEPQSPRERRAADRVARLQAECRKLLELSNDFLSFARLHELKREPTRLTEVVEEMADFFGPTARTAGIELKPYLPADLPAVLLDRDRFKQVLLNLLLNAAEAMPDGGELTLLAAPEGDGVRLEVIDTGIGMGPETREKIFRPFYTTKPGGNGMGLATGRKIVHAHGGRIDVQSERGRGTKFTIWLPAAVPALTEQPV